MPQILDDGKGHPVARDLADLADGQAAVAGAAGSPSSHPQAPSSADFSSGTEACRVGMALPPKASAQKSRLSL